MKKSLKTVILVAVLAIILLISGTVHAATANDFKDWGVAEVTTAEGVTTIKLTHDLIDGDQKLSQDLIINSGEKVILDLNGYTLQGYTAGCETILVNEGAELTIVDNSENGNGKIIPATGASAVQLPVIRNNGTLTIENGILQQNDAYGVIINWGTLTINGGQFVQSEDARWSALDNKGTLTINKGDFDGAGSFWMVRNEATLEVKGGDFDSTGSANMIGSIYEGESLPEENNVTTKVSNGTFDSKGGIFVVYEGTELNISGGEITSIDSNAVYNAGNTNITGGTIKSENSAAVVLVNNEDAKEQATINVTSDANITSVAGKSAVEVINNDKDANVGVVTDKDGNIIAGKVEITVPKTEVNAGDAIDVTITVAGEQVSTGYTVKTSDAKIIKVNSDNTLTAVAAGEANVTVALGNVEETVTIKVLATEAEDPATDPTEEENPSEEPTTEPSEEATDTEEATEEDSGIVQTGDYIYIAIAALALVIIANVVYTVRKRKSVK